VLRAASRGGVSLSLAGWLWADILLGLFAIFLAASAVASAGATKTAGLDPTPLQFSEPVDSQALLSADPTRSVAEQQRIVAAVSARVASLAPGRHVAIVFAYGTSERAADGDRIASLATQALTTGAFKGAVLKPMHELVAGDPGTSISFEVYLNE
jgi:hypothetical protein